MGKSIKGFFLYSILFLSGIMHSIAQQSAIHTNKLVAYNQAITLYNNQQFLAAQNLFTKVKKSAKDQNIIADCAYYEASCAVWLDQPDADQLMEDFVLDYPLSVKRNAAYLDVANYYFDNGKYSYARKWYDKVKESSMNAKEKERYYFNNGYAYFKAQRFKEATKYFENVQNTEAYGAQSKYYLGFIAYEGDHYLEANELFDEVKDLEKYNKNLSYFQSDMSFKSGKFQEAIDSGLKQLPNSNPKEKSQLNKIIGESYFNLQQYEKSLEFLPEYKGLNGRWTNTDYYQLGYAYYKTGQYQQAVSEFNKIIGGKDATAQNAYYHLADSYMQLGKKQQALNAFKNASEMKFEAKIREDAFYNYAKLAYDIGNAFESPSNVIQSYLDTFPETIYKDEMNELLINSFITSKNYKSALTILESKRIENNEVYQEVALYYGLELYRQNKYTEAIQNFDKAISLDHNQKFTARAIYWKGESYYQLEDYPEAFTYFERFRQLAQNLSLDENEVLPYNLGYTLFKLKRYQEAIKPLQQFVSETNQQRSEKLRTDAYMRLGDSNFVTSQYWPAMEAYNKAITLGGKEADYAQFQKAISYGFVGKNDQKIAGLNDFLGSFSKSSYIDDALYELGNVYVAEKQSDKAINAYKKIQNQLPQSILVPKAMLKEALIYFNADQSEKALSKFKTVTAQYPDTPEAIQAVQTARVIYVDLGRTDEYASWGKRIGFC